MKQGSTLFLKAALFIMAIGVIAICIFPISVIIRSGEAGIYQPILIGLYAPVVPFLIALFQAFKLLNYIDQNRAFSELSTKALKNIKYCAISISAMFIIGMPYIYYVAEIDDAPGVILIGLVFIFASSVIATFAAVLQRLIQNAVDLKSENDLTV